MVASCAARGYKATTVADLIALAGVSRATFYQHFKDKSECFRAAVEVLLIAGLDLIAHHLEGESPPEERTKRALQAFLRLTAEQPAAAQTAMVQAYSAGSAGLEPINDAFEQACELANEAMRKWPGHDRTPEQLSRAVVGGIHRVLYVHLHRGEEKALLDACDDLWNWARGFGAPESFPQPKKRSYRWDPPISRGRDRYEHILRSFASTVKDRGYLRVTVPEIAAEAGVSNSTFYQHFENKEDALHAALDLSGAQLLAAAIPPARREPDWPHALRRAIEGLCQFLVSEPAYASLRAVEVYTAGPGAIAHRDRAWEEIIEQLVPAEIRHRTSPSASLSICASAGAVYGLLYERVRKGELDKVITMAPLLTYITLTPLIGTETAMNVAVSRTSMSTQN
jgi:AcrR family transcriptional regulator